MAFSISDFNSAINRHGLAKSNLFEAQIFPPSGLTGNGNVTARDLVFFCRTAQIPEFSLETAKIVVRGYGPGEARPVGFENTPFTAVFMVDRDYNVLKFFHKWMGLIVNYTGSGGSAALATASGLRTYELNYKDDYAGGINISMWGDNTGNSNPPYTYIFEKAYPIAIGDVQTAWENAAEVLTVSITFSYENRYVSGVATASAVTSATPSSNGRTGAGGSTFESRLTNTARQIIPFITT